MTTVWQDVTKIITPHTHKHINTNTNTPHYIALAVLSPSTHTSMFSDLCANPYIFSSLSPEHKACSALLDFNFNSEHIIGSNSLSFRECTPSCPEHKNKGMADLHQPDISTLNT
jgi:hypothetical protein